MNQIILTSISDFDLKAVLVELAEKYKKLLIYYSNVVPITSQQKNFLLFAISTSSYLVSAISSIMQKQNCRKISCIDGATKRGRHKMDRQLAREKEIDIQLIVKKAFQHNQVEEGACSYILTVLENYESSPLIHTSTLGDLQWLLLRYDQKQLSTIEFSTPNYVDFLFPLRLGVNEGNPSQAQYMVNEAQELDLILLYNKTVAMNLFQKQIKQIIEPFCKFSYDNLDLQLLCDMIAEKTEEVSKTEKEDTPFKKLSKLNQPGKFKSFSKSGFPGEIFVQLAQVKSQLSF